MRFVSSKVSKNLLDRISFVWYSIAIHKWRGRKKVRVHDPSREPVGGGNRLVTDAEVPFRAVLLKMKVGRTGVIRVRELRVDLRRLGGTTDCFVPRVAALFYFSNNLGGTAMCSCRPLDDGNFFYGKEETK